MGSGWCWKPLFCFTVLPFGLSSAPYLFTKIFRPLVRYWRGLGIHLVLYLDDGAGCEKDFPTTQHCSYIVRSDLVKVGLVPNCGWVSHGTFLVPFCPSLNLALIDYCLLLLISSTTCRLSPPVSLPLLLAKLFLYRHVSVISPLSCLGFCSLQSPFAKLGIPLLI